MRKKLILILSIVILGCANNKEQVSTIKIKDEKAQKISEMMEGYVDNNFDSSIISDDAIIKFNKIEMTKTGFKDLVNTHHAMFSEISFPEGWMETVNYIIISGIDLIIIVFIIIIRCSCIQKRVFMLWSWGHASNNSLL